MIRQRTEIENKKKKNEPHRIGSKNNKSRGGSKGKKHVNPADKAFIKHRDREAVHKMLEEQLKRKFDEQKDQIAKKIKEVDEAKARIKDHMEQKMQGIFDFDNFNRSAADALKTEVG